MSREAQSLLRPVARPAPRPRQERWAPRQHGVMRDPRLPALSDGAVRVYAALVDGPEQSYLRGLLDFGGKTSIAAALAAVVPQTAEQIDAHLDALRAVDLIALDRARKLVYVPACQQHVCAAPQSVQALTATLAQLADLPACPVVERVKADLLDVTARAEEVRTRRRTGEVAETLHSRLIRALSTPLREVAPEEDTGQLTLRFPTQLAVAPMDEKPNRGGAAEAARDGQGDVSPAPVLEGRNGTAGTAQAGRDLGQDSRGSGVLGAVVAPAWPDRRSAGAVGDGGERDVRPSGAPVPTVHGALSGQLPEDCSEFGTAWQRLAAACPALDGKNAGTPTGLPHREQYAAAIEWVRWKSAGRPQSAMDLLPSYIASGGLRWIGSGLRSYVARNLEAILTDAVAWDEAGRQQRKPAKAERLGNPRSQQYARTGAPKGAK